MNYREYFADYLKAIEDSLDQLLPSVSDRPETLHEAMRYSVLGGGKRFRPVLLLSACEAVGGDWRKALHPAVAVELVHAYSLVHDDLPALDNDDMRRGQETCHKKYGEAMAILTGDALLNRSFEILSQIDDLHQLKRILSELSTSAGSYGMIGGQVADITLGQQSPDLLSLDYIHIHKTGKLIKASALCGAYAGNASEEDSRHIQLYGEYLGMAFQAVDDMLDGDGYMQLMKASEVREKVRDLIANAKKEVKRFGDRGQGLINMADYLVSRIPGEKYVSVD